MAKIDPKVSLSPPSSDESETCPGAWQGPMGGGRFQPEDGPRDADETCSEDTDHTVRRLAILNRLSSGFLHVCDEATVVRQVVRGVFDLFPQVSVVSFFVNTDDGWTLAAHADGDGIVEGDGLNSVVDEGELETFPFTALADRATHVIHSTECPRAMVRLALPVGDPHARMGLLVMDVSGEFGGFSDVDVHIASLLATNAAGALGTARLLSQASVRQARVEEDGRQKIEFVAGLVHEVKTPLTVFRGFLDLLAEEQLSPDGRRYLNLMTQDAERLSRTMTELLHLARLESGYAPSKERLVDLSDVVASVMEEFRQPCIDKGLELCGDPLPREAAGALDDDKLKRILRNLLENAVKFSNPGERICVSVRLQDGWATLDVADTGRGIESEHLPYLTESFYQVRRSGAENKDGVGLGLAIVGRLIHSLGGALTIESKPGRGSTFSVTFPFTRSDEGGGSLVPRKNPHSGRRGDDQSPRQGDHSASNSLRANRCV